MNVLLTAAGRRAYLVDYFREALRGRGLVVAADATWSAPALSKADVPVTLPYASDETYVDQLLAVCKEHEVRLVIPLNDLELSVLSRCKKRLLDEGIMAVVSDPEVIDLCFDKLATYRFCVQNGIRTAETFGSLDEAISAIDRETDFPLVIKPRWGSGSIGVERVYSDDELHLAYRLGKLRLGRTILSGVSQEDPERALLIQRLITGPEFGVDIVNDFQGRPVAVYVKRKLAMRAGETDKAQVVDEPQIEQFGYRLGAMLGHVGVLDCDLFWDGTEVSLLEMNPRFGGGYPFSHSAGADVPGMFLYWAGMTPDEHCTGSIGRPQKVRGSVRVGASFAKYDLLIETSSLDVRTRS